MNFKDFYLITEGDIYKTTYQSDRYGGDHTIGLTIEFVDLRKTIEGDENIQWGWYLIIDGKDEITIWRDKDDGGCYYLEKDEYGNKGLGEPVKDPELLDEIREYIKKVWPLEKREAFIRKREIMSGLKDDAKDAWSNMLD